MTPIAKLVTAFVREYMPTVRGYSPETCETYAHALKLFFLFAAGQLHVRPSELCLEQINSDLVLAFLSHMETNRHACAATRNARLAAIKALMRYVETRVRAVFDQT